MIASYLRKTGTAAETGHVTEKNSETKCEATGLWRIDILSASPSILPGPW
jgi:hypothetical protein